MTDLERENLEKVKNYLRIDYTEEDVYISSLLSVSLIYIDSMVGESYKTDENAVKLAEVLQFKIIRDMYEERSTFVQNSVKTDRITNSILDKLSNY